MTTLDVVELVGGPEDGRIISIPGDAYRWLIPVPVTLTDIMEYQTQTDTAGPIADEYQQRYVDGRPSLNDQGQRVLTYRGRIKPYG